MIKKQSSPHTHDATTHTQQLSPHDTDFETGPTIDMPQLSQNALRNPMQADLEHPTQGQHQEVPLIEILHSESNDIT